ncbi:MAG: hypothetical protein WC484_07080 [Candidatus Omnitrophota bacterium]|jgi:hypothetical protein
MGKITDWIDRWILSKDSKEKVVCALCGKKIEDAGYVMVRGAVVINDKSLKNPIIFTCIEQAFNYAQGYYAHAICWIGELRRLGVPLYDMDKVREEYNKKRR